MHSVSRRADVTFIKDHGPESVQILKRGEVDIADEDVEQEGKVSSTLHASIDEASCCDALQIVNI